MKKLFILAAIAAISSGASAQAKFGIQVGGNLANVKSESTDAGTTVKDNTKAKFGFLAGLVAEIPLASSLSFRPELNYIQKGSKANETLTASGFTEVTTATLKLNFIELPLNIVYSVPAGSGNLFFGAGPSIGYGISGKSNYTSTSTSAGTPTTTQSDDQKIIFDGKKDADVTDGNAHLKALDFGGNILAGYKMSNGAFINVGYTMGFSNLIPDDGASLKTNGFTIKIGYLFGGNSEYND